MKGKILDFAEKKAEIKGDVTPRAVIESVLEYMDENPGEIKSVALVGVLEDGTMQAVYSTNKHSTIIGLYEIGKMLVYDGEM